MAAGRGVEGKRIIELIEDTLDQLNLSVKGIKAIGTVEVKREEAGIIEACKYFNCSFKDFFLRGNKKGGG